jgi:hypothetical protein
MKMRPYVIPGVIAMIVASLAVVWWMPGPSHQAHLQYEGKPAHYWLAEISRPALLPSSTSVIAPLHSSNAIPVLILALRRKDIPFVGLYLDIRSKLPITVQSNLPPPIDATCGRRNAALLLGRMETVAAPAIPALIHGLNDRDAEVRSRAAWSLGMVGQADPAVIRGLGAALRDRDSAVGFQAALALEKIGHRDRMVILPLIGALKFQGANVRYAAAWSLGRLGQGNTAVISALEAGLGDADAQVRCQAALSLGQVGQKNGVVIPALTGALNDTSPWVRSAASSALKMVDPTAGVVRVQPSAP